MANKIKKIQPVRFLVFIQYGCSESIDRIGKPAGTGDWGRAPSGHSMNTMGDSLVDPLGSSAWI